MSEARNTRSLPDLQAQERDPDPHPPSSERGKRTVKPTWKVMENLETAKCELYSDVSSVWKKVLSHIDTASRPASQELPPEGVLEQLCTAYQMYMEKSDQYIILLKKLNLPETLNELQGFQQLNSERDCSVRDIKAKIEARIARTPDASTRTSKSCKHSKRSSRSSSSKYSTLTEQLIRARAKAETTKVLTAFAQKRAEMDAAAAQKRAEMDAEAARMEALEKECEHATAMAELKVLKQAISGSQRDSVSLCEMEAEDPIERTRDYMLSQDGEPQIITNTPDGVDASPEHQDADPLTESCIQGQYNASKLELPSYSSMRQNPASHQTPQANTYMQPNMPAGHYTLDNHTVPPPHVAETIPTKPVAGLNAYATPYFPMFQGQDVSTSMYNTAQPTIVHPKSERTDMSDFARYMIRRELTKTGLTRFDDQPENYRGWKSAFRTVTGDLGITAAEELDLLIKWLGPQSTERVKRLRSVHISNPTAGLMAAWERLERNFGSPEAIEDALFKRLQSFPKISSKDSSKFLELSDLLLELQLAKADTHLPGLSYLDTARGVNPIISKLPYNVQEKWTAIGSKYKKDHQVSFPPFSYFCEFIKDIAERKNDPSFSYGESSGPASPPSKYVSTRLNDRNRRSPVSVKKTDILPLPTSAPGKSNKGEKIENPNRECPIHKKPHPLKKCIGFRKKPLQERKELLKKFGVCYRCCASTEHLTKDCKTTIKCMECDIEDHVQALHPYRPDSTRTPSSTTSHGGEDAAQTASHTTISSSCTEVCGEGLWDKSCAKICLVNVYPNGHPEKAVKVYVLLDDQSNRSLARSELFDMFNLKGNAYPYTLSTCSGVTEVSGRRASGLIATFLKNTVEIPLPTLVECNQIPSNREEIPTPEAALHHPHLKGIANKIPALNNSADILILLGRDILRLHKVRQQINGPHDAPFAQRFDLGWVIIGDVCIHKMKRPNNISSYKTHILPNGRSTHFQPCPHHYWVKEKVSNTKRQQESFNNMNMLQPWDENLGSTVFDSTSEDNKLAPIREDKDFIKVMDKEFVQDDSNSWVAPLPFRFPRARLPNNLQQATARFSSLKRTLKRKPEMEKHFIDFMQNIFDKDHAEPAPPLKEGEECWYLPSFGVYHPRKPNQIRVVFDSSAQTLGLRYKAGRLFSKRQEIMKLISTWQLLVFHTLDMYASFELC
ncbi:uncharacterized protein [Dendrobates tinctorius]|uniref:uncharacterized protein n=1 Tax=Dendrobates tinctorius TaxID=92724 RepID=UPI003CCA400E